jgi:VWFA-related protein
VFAALTAAQPLQETFPAAVREISAQAQAAPAQDGQATPKFRSSVELVSVAAVVRDRSGKFVNDLSKKDFEIVESGQPRPILDFRAQLDGPVKVAVLLDISGSMRLGQRETDARRAASLIFSALDTDDEAAVFTVDTGLDEVQGFTTDRAALEASLGAVQQPYGQTSLYDAIAHTARAAKSASAGPRGLPQRSAVVVITDGVDTRSRLTPADVSVAASGIDIPVYIVAVMAAVDDPREARHGRTAAVASDLQELARGTGGELFIASAPAHASVAARQLVSELRHQYVLAFEASSQNGWRPLEVRTRQASLVVRARTGYSGGSSASPSSPSDDAAPAVASRTSQRPAQPGR